MLPDPLTLLALALLGGLVALDGTSLGQLMVSRPLVAATLAGAVAGAPAEGAAVGVLLEALHLAVLPVGAARYPEAGPAAVAAGGVYAAGPPSPAALLVAVAFALGWEWVGGRSVVWLRQRNARLAVSDAGADGLDPRHLAALHWRAVGVDFARGLALTLAGVLLLAPVLPAAGWLGLLPGYVRLVLGLTGAAGAASALRLFGRRRLPYFAAGAAAGLLFVLLGR